jgi:hypothetical protein
MQYFKDPADGVYSVPSNIPNPLDKLPSGSFAITKAEFDALTAPSAADIAAAAQAAQDLADRQETQADAKFRALTSKSPAQVKAWVRNRFPTLTLPEQDDLATVVQVVGVLARRL